MRWACGIILRWLGLRIKPAAPRHIEGTPQAQILLFLDDYLSRRYGIFDIEPLRVPPALKKAKTGLVLFLGDFFSGGKKYLVETKDLPLLINLAAEMIRHLQQWPRHKRMALDANKLARLIECVSAYLIPGPVLADSPQDRRDRLSDEQFRRILGR